MMKIAFDNNNSRFIKFSPFLTNIIFYFHMSLNRIKCANSNISDRSFT